jgi:hypothetical protein
MTLSNFVTRPALVVTPIVFTKRRLVKGRHIFIRYGRDGVAQRINSSRLTARQLLKLPPIRIDWFALTSSLVDAVTGAESPKSAAATIESVKFLIANTSRSPECPCCNHFLSNQHECVLNDAVYIYVLRDYRHKM